MGFEFEGGLKLDAKKNGGGQQTLPTLRLLDFNSSMAPFIQIIECRCTQRVQRPTWLPS